MKKFLATMMTIVMTASLVSACGSSQSNSSKQETSSQKGTTEVAASTSEDTYPTGPIKVVVPYGAGGGTDLFCRVVVDKMSEIMGTSIEVSNVTGGGGTIGATEVTNSDADGYTLGFCISAPISVMPLYGETSYNLEDIQPICSAYSTTNVIAVPKDSSINSVDDLLNYINDNNGVLSYGGSGTGNIQHLMMEEWFTQVGTDAWDMSVVAYTDGDSAEALALMSGEVPFAIMQAQGVKSYVEEDQLKVIMVFGDTLPQWMVDAGMDVPTTSELGYECAISPIVGFWGPTGISQEVVDDITNAFEAATSDEETLSAINNLGLEVDFCKSEEYTEILKDLVPVASDLMKNLGMIE